MKTYIFKYLHIGVFQMQNTFSPRILFPFLRVVQVAVQNDLHSSPSPFDGFTIKISYSFF